MSNETKMSAPVDVLAVMEACLAGCAECRGTGQVPDGEPYTDNGPMQDLRPCEDCAEMREARAAVAELIEASREHMLQAARVQAAAAGSLDPNDPRRVIARIRLRAVLARVGGGK